MATPTTPAKRTRKPRATEAQLQLAVQDQDARVEEESRAVQETPDCAKAPLKGKLFRIDLDTGLMPLMEWAAANDSVDPANLQQAASLFYLLKDIVDPEDWDEFREHAKATKCKGDDFVKFQNAAAEAIVAVPTEEPENS